MFLQYCYLGACLCLKQNDTKFGNIWQCLPNLRYSGIINSFQFSEKYYFRLLMLILPYYNMYEKAEKYHCLTKYNSFWNQLQCDVKGRFFYLNLNNNAPNKTKLSIIPKCLVEFFN